MPAGVRSGSFMVSSFKVSRLSLRWQDWERGCGSKRARSRSCRVGNSRVTNSVVNRSPLERGAIECDSHVGENELNSKPIPEYRGARETLREATETIP